jgi:hypothetical protein
MADEDHDEFDDGGHEDDFDDDVLDEHETALIQRDLADLSEFEGVFRPEGYRGVAVFCQDCVEEHYYEWDMLRENLQMLLDTGETPVHEPAFAPDPDRYIHWDYARGYVDALQDTGVTERLELGRCPRCALDLPSELLQANFCPRCGAPFLRDRIAKVLDSELGLPEETVIALLAAMGLPMGPRSSEEA